MSKAPKPFGNTSFAIGDLTLESAQDRVSLHGSLDLTRDEVGLAKARQLRDYLSAVIATLERDPSLPQVMSVESPVLRANPLA